MSRNPLGSFCANAAMVVAIVALLTCSSFAARTTSVPSNIPNPPGADLDQFPVVGAYLSQDNMDSLGLRIAYLKNDTWVLDRAPLAKAWEAHLLYAPAAVLVDKNGVIRYDARTNHRIMRFDAKTDYGLMVAAMLDDWQKDPSLLFYAFGFGCLLLLLVVMNKPLRKIFWPSSVSTGSNNNPEPSERSSELMVAIRNLKRSLDNMPSGCSAEQPIVARRAKTIVIKV